MKIGLALSGGGVLGAAHIGVLEQLEKNNIKIDHISGTSAGSIIAAVYASGGLDAVNNFVEDITKLEYFGEKRPLKIISPARFFDQVFNIVSKYTEKNIEDTQIKLSIVATDIALGNEETFEQGQMVKTIMASSAYPGVFPIQEINDKLYFDGGVTRNLPADGLTDCDFKIGSNLYSIKQLENDKIRSMNRIQLISRTIDIYQKELAENFASQCDFCFELDSGSMKWYSFDKIKEIRESGIKQAEIQIRGLLDSLNNSPKE